MKRIHKILLTVSFVFAVCFSAGMFFTFSDSIKNNSNKDQTADAYSNVTYNYSLALVCLKSPVVKSTDTFQLKNVDYNIGKYVSEDGYTSTSLANTSITFTNFTGAGGCTGTSASGNGTNWIKGNVYMKLTFIGGDKHSYYDVNYSISSKNAGFEAYLSYCLINPLTSTDIGNVTASQVSSFWKTDSSQSAAKNMTHTLKFSGNETKNYYNVIILAPRKFNVTYDANGGKIGSSSSSTYSTTYGNYYDCPTPTREGYTFAGWYNSSGTRIYSSTYKTSASNETITARWTRNNYYVDVNHYVDGVNQSDNSLSGLQFNVNIGSSTDKSNVADFYQQVGYGETIDVWNIRYSSSVRYSHYSVTTSENSNSNQDSIKFNVPAQSVTVNLYFVSQSKVTVNANGGTYSGATSITQDKGTNIQLGVPTRPGYTFKGWVAKNGNGTFSTFGQTHDKTTDGFFDWSDNNIEIYDNSGNGNVVFNLISKPSDLNLPDSKRVLEITNLATCGWGYGFSNRFQSKANGVFYSVIHAKIPEGYKLMPAYNAHGNNTHDTWISNNIGTGTWKTYVFKWVCGSDGNFDTIGFFYIEGPSGSSENPVKWQVAYVGTYDATGKNVSENGSQATTYTTGVGDASLVALWDANEYNIVFDANGGTGTMSAQKHTYGYNKNLTANSFTRNGYIFLGWSRTKQNPISEYDASKITFSDGASVSNLTTGTENVTLYAVWLETWSAVGKDVELTTDASGAYLISTAEELGKVAYMNWEGENFEGKTIRLANNIDLAGRYWMPIGKNNTYFKGKFEGNNKKISSLKTLNKVVVGNYDSTYDYIGLFSKTSNAIIQDVILLNVSINANNGAGGIIGLAKNTTVRNCLVTGNVYSVWNAGGIVGNAYEGNIIENCVNRAEISGRTSKGGICGVFFGEEKNDKIIGCINYGTIKDIGVQENSQIGGIAGATSKGTIENCINYGNLESTIASQSIGGIVGEVTDNLSIISSADYSIVNLSTSNVHYGGIVGRNNVGTRMLVEYCSSVARVNILPTTFNSIYGLGSQPTIVASYLSLSLANTISQKAYGSETDFNEGFRYEKEMNNGLPMQVTLFEFAQNLPQQNDVFEVGLAGFELV